MIVRVLAELIIAAFLLLTVWTQIIRPWSKNRPAFPFFRRKKLAEELSDVNETLDQKKMRQNIDRLKKQSEPKQQTKKTDN